MTVGRSEEENLPSFSDPEDYEENLTDNGKYTNNNLRNGYIKEDCEFYIS